MTQRRKRHSGLGALVAIAFGLAVLPIIVMVGLPAMIFCFLLVMLVREVPRSIKRNRESSRGGGRR
jgi:hypothetical protein